MALLRKDKSSFQSTFKKHVKELSDKHSSHDDESNWLVSYADMMTLLCGFFIMLFSMSKVDENKYDSFKEALTKQFGGQYVSPSKELEKAMKQVLKEAALEQTVAIKSDPLGVTITFESTVFFDTLSSDITGPGQSIVLKLIAGVSKQQILNNKFYRVVVEGHTDGRPIVNGLYPSNWELSGARAARVVRMFLDAGYKATQLTAIGYADTHPVVDARTADGKWDETALSKNRRVVVRIMEPQVEAIPLPDSPISMNRSISNTKPTQAPTATAPAAAPVAAPKSPSH